MTAVITHTKVSAIADDPGASAAGEVLPSDWNANHTITGTVDISQGGTNATTAANARVNLLPSYTGNGGKVLAVNTGATDVEWITVSGSGISLATARKVASLRI